MNRRITDLEGAGETDSTDAQQAVLPDPERRAADERGGHEHVVLQVDATRGARAPGEEVPVDSHHVRAPKETALHGAQRLEPPDPIVREDRPEAVETSGLGSAGNVEDDA